MNRIGLLIGFLTMLVFVIPSWTAPELQQEEKKDEKKDVKKDETKDPEKKEKKDDEKKPEKKPAPEKFVYGSKFVTKIMSVGPNSNREFTVEKYELDPKKQQEFSNWVYQQQQQLQKQQFEIARQKDFKARINAQANYQKAVYNFEVDKAKRAGNLMSVKPYELRAAENAKVRTLFPPVEFDDLGFQKKWTKKELEERKDNTGLPGFGVDFDAIKSGQIVEIYLPKAAPAVKGKKKADDDPGDAKERQEFVLVVIRAEGGK